MTTITLPLFPLELVVFPGEELALHIFEDRYQELIRDCEDHGSTFGIPTYQNDTLTYGTEVVLEKVVNRYPSGACDVVCRGLRVFRINNFHNSLETKLYAGGSVTFLEQKNEPDSLLKNTFIELLAEFYKLLNMNTPKINATHLNSYTLSHKIGLTLEEELRFLQIMSENARYQYLINHLKVIIPTVATINRTKSLIRLNGHFKNFDPLDFTDYGK